MTHKIGILSDTHGLLRPEVIQHLKDCEAILHGGDISRPPILRQLETLAPVYAVRGNNDKEWEEELPETRILSLYGVTFFMIHNRKMIREDISGADVVIFGHSHRYEESVKEGTLWLNPGSCGPRRFSAPITLAVMEIEDDGSYRVKKIEIAHPAKNVRRTKASAETMGGDSQTSFDADEVRIPPDIRDRIPAIMKDMDHGRPLEEIAKRAGISYDLAEQICRLYVTHPGVDVDGIMRRMML